MPLLYTRRDGGRDGAFRSRTGVDPLGDASLQASQCRSGRSIVRGNRMGYGYNWFLYRE